MSDKPLKMFLSYAREDSSEVEKLYYHLRRAGFQPWLDIKDILAGEKWERSIWRAVRAADFFLACLTNRSVNKRGFLQKELKQALNIWQEKLQDDIYLIPCRLEECEVPEDLREFHWVDLFKPDGWERLLKAIAEGDQRQGRAYQQVSAAGPIHHVITKQHTDSDKDHLLYLAEISYPQIQPETDPWVVEVNARIHGWAVQLLQDFRKQSLAIGS